MINRKRLTNQLFLLTFAVFILLLNACSAAAAPVAPVALDTPGFVAPIPAATVLPENTPTPEHVLTPTRLPAAKYVQVTVWRSDPYVPILNYHRFLPDEFPRSSGTKLRLSEFRQDLERLYEAGYSLVDLDDWLQGDLRLTAGRRPLILTFDDAYFADQLFLGEDGQPSRRTGIGELLAFSKEYPDFGFTVSLFANYGDKLYANIETPQWWVNGEGWEESLARTIAWGIEHHVMPYNHLYMHPRLDLTEFAHIRGQAELNDAELRRLLALIGRQDLVGRVENYIALPYGVWPTSEAGKNVLMTYEDPEGRAVRAIFEAGYEYSPRFVPPPYDPQFDRFHVARMAGIQRSINFIVERSVDVPLAEECQAGPYYSEEWLSTEMLGEILTDSVRSGACPPGIFALEQGLYRVDEDGATPLTTDH